MMESENKYIQLSLFDTTGSKSLSRTPTPPTSMGMAETSHSVAANELSHLFDRLSKSHFRSKFHLADSDIKYIRTKGINAIRQHAADFVAKRLAPANIPNDGKQTPMRGHPIFLAQHATGCCCRGCFYKWHHIPAGRQLTTEEQRYAVEVLMAWIDRELYASNTNA